MSKLQACSQGNRDFAAGGRHVVLGGLILAFVAGCGVLSPAFLDLLDAGSGNLATIQNPSGHVIVAFVNNAEVDERLIDFLQSAEGGSLPLTEAEKRSLRPRVRFRVRVTYRDGQSNTVEFVSGSTKLVQTTFNAQAEPDLNQNDLDNVVAVCDVARVEVLQPVEVFVPVELRRFEFVEPTDNTPGFFRLASRVNPSFMTLQTDEVDADLNTTLQRNIGIRDGPAPADNVLCGTVVTIVLDGVLRVPFRDDQGGVPGFDLADLTSAASVGGRYEFRVSIQG